MSDLSAYSDDELRFLAGLPPEAQPTIDLSAYSDDELLALSSGGSKGMAPDTSDGFMSAYNVNPGDGILTKAMKKVGGIAAGLPKSAYDMGMEVWDDPGKAYNDVMAAERASRRRIPDQFKQMGAGVWQALNESPTYDPNATDAEGFNHTASFFNREGVSPSDLSNAGTNQGMEWSKQATTDLVKDRMNDRRTTKIGQIVESTNESIVQQAPGLLLTFAGQPQFGLPLTGVQTFGQKYAENRAAGMPVEDATANAGIQAGVEVGTEILPFMKFAKFMKPGVFANQSLRKQLAEVLIAEVPGEHLATALQNSSDAYFEEKDPAKRLVAVQKYIESNKFNEDQIDTFWTTLLQTGAMSAIGKTAHAVQNKLSTDPLLKMTPEQEKEYEDYTGKVADAKEYQRVYAPQIAAGTAVPVATPVAPTWLEAFNDLQRNTGDAITGGRDFTPESAQAAALRGSMPQQGKPAEQQDHPPTSFQNESYDDTSDMAAPKGPLESAANQTITEPASDDIPSFTPPVTPVTPEPVPADNTVTGTAPPSDRTITDADQTDFENAVLWENNLRKQGRSAIPDVAGESDRDYAWRLLSSYRAALTPTVANDSAAPVVQQNNEPAPPTELQLAQEHNKQLWQTPGQRGLMQSTGTSDAQFANSLLQQYRTAQEKTNGATDIVPTLPGTANVDGIQLPLSQVQKTDDGSASNLSQPGGITNDLPNVPKEVSGQTPQMPTVRSEDVVTDTEPTTVTTITNTPPRKSRSYKPAEDDLMSAIALNGGIDLQEATAQWGKMASDDADNRRDKKTGKRLFGERQYKIIGNNPVFQPVNGLTIDKMGQALADDGYIETDEHGKYDRDDLLAKITDGLSGASIYSKQNTASLGESAYNDQVNRHTEMLANMTDQEHADLHRNQWHEEQADLLYQGGDTIDSHLAESYDTTMAPADWHGHAQNFKEALDATEFNAGATGQIKGTLQTPATGTTESVPGIVSGDAAIEDQTEAGTGAEITPTATKGRGLFTQEQLVEFDKRGIDVGNVPAHYKAEALQQLDYQQEQEAKLASPDYNDQVQAEYDRIAAEQKATTPLNATRQKHLQKLKAEMLAAKTPKVRKALQKRIDLMKERTGVTDTAKPSTTEKQNQLFPTPSTFGTKPQPKTTKGDVTSADLVDNFTNVDSVQPSLSIQPENNRPETSDFGPVFRQFKHDAQGAIAKLKELQEGEAIAALHHPEVGDIDLVWGKEGTAEKDYEDGHGLAKIIKKHPEVVDKLQETLDTLKKNETSSRKSYLVLESEDHKAVVRLDWNRQEKKWLLTEFKKEEEIGTEKRAGTPSVTETGSPSHQSLSTDIINPPVKDVKPEPATKLEDFGEKIGGARKDFAARFTAAKSLDVATEPFSKTWPEPDYIKMLAQGFNSADIDLVRAIRDEVPDKPRKEYKIKQWVALVESLRDHAEALLSGDSDVARKVMEKSKEDNSAVKNITARAELYAAVGHGVSLRGVTLSSNFYNVFHGEENITKWQVEMKQKPTAFSNMPRELGIGNSKEEAIADFKSKLDAFAKPAGKKQTEYVVYSKRGQEGYFVGKKIGKDYVDLHHAATVVLARSYIAQNRADLDAKLAGMKDLPAERRENNSPRTGEDYRNGQDATPELFQSAFGFRGVEFGNYVNNNQRQMNLNEAFDALHDLSTLLGIPTQAISLNGELGLAFGARGHGGVNPAAAHYEPGTVAINLTKNNGAGSLAHEWFHAFDSYLSRKRGYKNNFITDKTVKYGAQDETRQELIDAFISLRKALEDTNLTQRSRNLDKTRSKDYWSTGIEMHARAFENYVIDKLAGQSEENDYLANIKGVDEYAGDLLNGLMEGKTVNDLYPYLLDSEVKGVVAAFNNLFTTLETKDTAKGVALFARKSSFIGKAIGAKELDVIIDNFTASLKNAPGITQFETFADLAAAVPAIKEIAEAEGQDTINVSGVYHNGQVYLIRMKITSAADAQEVLFHEAFGHFGIRSLLGKDFAAKMTELYQAIGGATGLAKIAAKNGIQLAQYGQAYAKAQYSVEDRRILMTEELLAHIQGNNASKTVLDMIKEIIGAVRASLRKSGFFELADYGETDLLHLLKRSAEYVRSGKSKANSGTMFMTAWHGSPHDHDGFSTEHIGSGEGAQAYGYGLYFAGDRDVAEYYKKTLSGNDIRIDGKRSFEWNIGNQEKEALLHADGDVDAAIKYLKHYQNEVFGKKGSSPSVTLSKQAADAISELELLKESDRVTINKGKLYQVELAPKESEYLLWDLPLNEQSEMVKDVIKDVLDDIVNRQSDYHRASELSRKYQHVIEEGNIDGASLYSLLSTELGPAVQRGKNTIRNGDDQAASEYLHSLGIRGIKYLDGSSRNKGEGAHNYVIFNDADVSIQAKYQRGTQDQSTDSGLGDATVIPIKSIPFITRILETENAVQVTVNGGNSDALKNIARMFNKTLVFYRTKKTDGNITVGAETNKSDATIQKTVPDKFDGAKIQESNGFIVTDKPNIVFLNSESNNHLLYVMGHELSHTLQEDNPELWGDLASFITTNTSDFNGALEHSRQPGQNDSAALAEYVGDVVGEMFGAPSLWQRMSIEKPSLFKVLSQKVIALLDKVKAFMVGSKNTSNAAISYLRTVQNARDVVADVMAQYAISMQDKINNGDHIDSSHNGISVDKNNNIDIVGTMEQGKGGDYIDTDTGSSKRLLQSTTAESARESGQSLKDYLETGGSTGSIYTLARRQEQDRLTREWAKTHDLPIHPEAYFFDKWNRTDKIKGGENRVYFEGSSAFKLNNLLYHQNGLAAFADRLVVSAEYFPDTAIEIIGFAETKQGIRPLLRQELVITQHNRLASPVEIRDDLLKRGFILLDRDNGSWLSPDQEYIVNDAGNTNVLVDESGLLRYIDIIFKKTNKEQLSRDYPRLKLPEIGDIESSPTDHVKYSLRKGLESVSEQSLIENLKGVVEPNTLARFASKIPNSEDIKDTLAHVFGNDLIADLAMSHLQTPLWVTENHPDFLPVYETAKERDENKMDYVIRMLSGLYDKDGKATAWDKVKDTLFNWDAGKETGYGKLIRESKLTSDERSMYDELVFEADVMGAEYSSLGFALRNPRINKLAVTERVFDFYQKSMALQESARKVHIAIIIEMMHKAGAPLEKIAATLARNHAETEDVSEEKLKAELTELMESMEKEGTSIDVIARHVADYRGMVLKRKGRVHRNHGEGDRTVNVYHHITALDFDVDTVSRTDGTYDRVRLPGWNHPGNDVVKQVKHIVSELDGTFKQTDDGALIMLFSQGKGDVALQQLVDIQLVGKDGEALHKNLVYRRFLTSEGAARKQLRVVNKDLAAALPVHYRTGETYSSDIGFKENVSEDMYRDAVGDMATEQILNAAVNRAVAQGEIDKDEATAMKEAFIQDIAESFMARGAGSYQIRRLNRLIEGYDRTAALGKFESYVQGVSGMLSKAQFAFDEHANLQKVTPQMKPYAYTYIKDMLRNMGRGDQVSGNLRAIASIWYLGYNFSWMLVNSTQPYVMGQSELSQHTTSPVIKIATAEKDILTGKLSAQEKALFDEMTVRASDHDSVMSEMAGGGDGGDGKYSRWLGKAVQTSMAVGQKVEVLNRHTMILAAYRVFKDEKGQAHDEALKNAMRVNSMVNIDMGRYNLPTWARTATGRTLYALQSYIQHMLNYLYHRTTSGNRTEQKAVLRLLFAMFLLGGLPAGAPGSDELDKLIQMFFGYSPKLALKAWTHSKAKDYDSAGEMVDAFIWHGLPGAGEPLGIGVSLTGATQLRMPLISSVIAGDDMIKSISGPVGGLVAKGVMGAKAAGRGDYYRMAEYLAPTFIANPMSAYRQATDGVKSASGKRVEYQGKQLKMQPHEAALRTIGLQPVRTADISETRGFQKDMQAEWNGRRKEALDNYRMSRKMKFVQEFNKELRGSQAQGLVGKITPESLANVWGKTNKKQSDWQREYGN